MSTASRVLFAAVLTALVHAPAEAATILRATITNDQEVVRGPLTTTTGDPRPLSSGFAILTLNDAQTQLSLTATIYGIDVTGTQTADVNDNLVAAHIHVGAGFGANAPVRWGFFGTPDNDNNPDQLVVMPFAAGVGGTLTSIWDAAEGNAGTTLTSNLPAILAGLSYLNFHTVQFGGGEIRGQIVPEPGVLSLMLVGLLGVARARRAR